MFKGRVLVIELRQKEVVETLVFKYGGELCIPWAFTVNEARVFTSLGSQASCLYWEVFVFVEHREKNLFKYLCGFLSANNVTIF